MKLDTRQRAMLAEMGVRVWQPEDPAAAPAGVAAAPTPVQEPPAPPPAPLRRQAAAPVAVPVPAPAAAAPVASTAVVWQMDAPQPMYPEAPPAAAPAWLVLLETPTPDDPRAGEAGDLLLNMLRAMRVADNPNVFIAPVRRAPARDGQDALAQALAQTRPVVVLALGLGAARALLGGNEPLGRLRGAGHRLPDGTPLVVSYAPADLLRQTAAKRDAWADLQRAMAIADAMR
ncbi:uracil-DNA glycosylase family protein [Comamonas badia]|uniref:uracil-DNA glycosylase family protein n=1 Tax=Comamonas badia TaxID=265291 RepID=UPI000426B59F|nr:uracil-DNA glycosylase family protein [Comamonas badia]